MSHVISVDDVTYEKLLTEAKRNERTIVGQLRWLINGSKPLDIYQKYGDIQTPKLVSAEQMRIKELNQRLMDIDEDDPEYEEIIDEIREIQESMDEK